MMKLLEFYTRSHVLRYVLISAAYLQLCYKPSSANPVCHTANCKDLGDYYKTNMKQQGEPCNDFYDYACHNWGYYNLTIRPKDKTIWNVDQWLAVKAFKDVRDVLENVQAPEGTIYDQAKGLYMACVNLPFREKTDSNTLKSITGAAGYWPMVTTNDPKVSQNVPWWEIESYYISQAGESSILNFHLVANPTKNNEIIIALFPPDSPYGMLKLLAPFDVSHKESYKAFLLDVIKGAGTFNTQNLGSVIDKNLEDVIKFREKIRAIIKTPDQKNDCIILTLTDFQDWYNVYSLKNEAAKINWSELVRSLYKNSKNRYLLAIHNKPSLFVPLFYFSKLATILATTPKHVIVNHVHLYFAERHVKLSTQMETNLKNSFIEGIHETGQIRYEPPRWQTCINHHNLGIILGYMYIEAHFGIQNKQEVTAFLGKLVELLKIRVSQSSWLDQNIKNISIHKLNNLQGQIGFPDWYVPSATRRTPILPDINPIFPNALYVPELNRVGVSGSFLQWPIFMPNLPYVVKYGAAGFSIGHEINHALDDVGLQYDAFGVKKKLWPDYMYNRYNVQTQCFDEQYKKYKNRELHKRHITEIPQYSTLTEDIADVMGLKIAYMGYKEELRKNNGWCPVLPGLESLDCEKLFFIAFANVFCAASTPSAEEQILLRDTHNLPQIRVNGAVGNMEEFLQAFNCKQKHSIVPETKCDIWK